MIYTCEQRAPDGSRACKEQAAYRFLWPGFVEYKICETHAIKARASAKKMNVELSETPPSSLLFVPGDSGYLLPLDEATEETHVLRFLDQAARGKR